MPVMINVTIFWSPDNDQMSYYAIYRNEIEEMICNYDITQADLFTFVNTEVMRQWLWDVFCREPHEVIVDEIIYN